ncbi:MULTISPECIES: TspO/MBR family protein [Prauserella salsuginis group]|uniref:TspO/MBR family protein n=1 Tax=Prauserella salsuginis TaxID=387889 RepID=A0ABW6FYW2_9PSEU|nr:MULTISPECIES: TspO/MBR family protein [Prauserella salsuginis group]MCR3720296.1 TspO and MBR related proteins [Prauserella flava]MCR3733996.1 TspO and MBR related proteins [Prauserella salsuginis]
MTTPCPARPVLRDVGGAVAFLVCVAIVAVVGSVAASSSSQQYAALTTPPWAPPPWLFGPVWTVLYLIIALSGWLVWRRAGSIRAARVPLGVYAVQLVLNMAWTPLFFGAGRYGIAFAEIILLVVAVGCTIGVFARIHRAAAWLLVPYAVWTLFAAALNGTIWLLNT